MIDEFESQFSDEIFNEIAHLTYDAYEEFELAGKTPGWIELNETN